MSICKILFISVFFLFFPSGMWGSFFSQNILNADKEISFFREKCLSSLKKDKVSEKTITCFVLGMDEPLKLSEKKLLKVASFDDKGETIKQNKHGTHPVVSFEGAHYKTVLEHQNLRPFHELAFYYFQKFLIGEGAPPSFFMWAITSQGKIIFLQVSKTVLGNSFQDVMNYYISLDGSPPQKSLDSKSLTAFLLTSFLTYPTDAKPDNFIVKDDKLLSIDNDQNFSLDLEFTTFSQNSFSDFFFSSPEEYLDEDEFFLLDSSNSSDSQKSIEKKESPRKEESICIDLNFRNVFCLYDVFMEQIVDADLFDNLKRINPSLFMIEWLGILDFYNQAYENLKLICFKQRDFIEKSFSFPNSLKFPKLDIQVLFQRLNILCTLNIPLEKSTFRYIFSIINPLTSLYYKQLAKDHEDPLQSLKDLYETTFPFEYFITEKMYVGEGKSLGEVLDIWRRIYRDNGEDRPIDPREIIQLFFENNLFTYDQIKDQNLSLQGRNFLYSSLNTKRKLIWDIVFVPHINKQSKMWEIISDESIKYLNLNILSLKKDTFLYFKEESLKEEKDFSDLEFEYASYVLTNLIIGKGSLHSFLIRRHNKRLLIFEKPSSSEEFSSLSAELENDPNFLEKLDPQSISEILLSSMIINVFCDHPENFFVYKDTIKKTYRLVRRDSQGSLRATFNNDKGNIFSFLFLHKEMNNKIRPNTLEKIIFKNPSWKEDCFLKKELREISRFNIDNIWKRFENNTANLNLPVNIKYRLKDRLYFLHDFLWDYSFYDKSNKILKTYLTHKDIFLFLKPDLKNLYSDFLGKGYNESLWKEFLEKVYGNSSNRNSMNSTDSYIKGNITYTEENQEFVFVKAENLEKGEKIVETDASLITKIQENNVEILPIFFKIPAYRRFHILQECDFSHVNSNFLDEFFKNLSKNKLKDRGLHFRNAQELEDKHLKKINFKYLSYLKLDNCPKITEGFLYYLSQHNNLIELYLSNLPLINLGHNITNHKINGKDLVVNEDYSCLTFMYLRSLSLIGMPNLKHIVIDAPNLHEKYIVYDDSIQLKNLAKLKDINDSSSLYIQNSLTDASLRQMLSSLLSNNLLISLDLSNNNIGDEGINYLSHFLLSKDNQSLNSLTEIDLRNNSFREKGIKEIYSFYIKHHQQNINSPLLFLWIGPIQGAENLRALHYKSMTRNAIQSYILNKDINILEKTDLSNIIKTHLKNFENRSHFLSLSKSSLTFLDFIALSEFYNNERNNNVLEILDLGAVNHVSLQKNFNYFIELLKNQKNLKKIYLNDIPFSFFQWETILPVLLNMKQLEYLVLSRSAFPSKLLTNLIKIIIDEMNNLTFLSLSGNSLKGRDINPIISLAYHPALETVDLSYNNFNNISAQNLLKFSFKKIVTTSLLFKNNDMSPNYEFKIHKYFISSLLSRAFDKGETSCLNFLVRFDIPDSLLTHIKLMNESSEYIPCPKNLWWLNLEALYVLGYSITKQSNITDSLILEGHRFMKGSFLTLYNNFLNKISNLKTLSLVNNHLQFEDIEAIEKIIKNNPFLEKIKLQNNKFGEKGIKRIFKSIRKLKSLKKINLLNNIYENITAPKHFENCFLTTLRTCEMLSNVAWDQTFMETSLNQEIKEILDERKNLKILKIRKSFEEKMILTNPKDIINLFQNIDITQEKISKFLGVSQSNISQLKNNYPSVTGEKILKNLKKITPATLESKEFLNLPDFFIKRYGLSRKTYEKIMNSSEFSILLLSQPVFNPYCFVKDGFEEFKKFFFIDYIEKLQYIKTPDDLIKSFKEKVCDIPSSSIYKLMGLTVLFFGAENFADKYNAVSYLNKHQEENFPKIDREVSYYIGQIYFETYKRGLASLEQSFLCLLQASEGKHREACYFIAQMYKEGLGCIQDKEKYEEYILEAAKMGHIQANYELGIILWKRTKDHAKNPKFKKDRKKIFEYFKFAADHKHVNAKAYVDLCEKNGFGTQKK